MDLDDIWEQFLMQTKSMKDDKLEAVGNAVIAEMIQRKKEREVLERFGEIKEHEKKKNNRIVTYYMAYDGRRQITAATRDALIEKLYNLIEDNSTKAITVEQLFEIYEQKRLLQGHRIAQRNV